MSIANSMLVHQNTGIHLIMGYIIIYIEIIKYNLYHKINVAKTFDFRNPVVKKRF